MAYTLLSLPTELMRKIYNYVLTGIKVEVQFEVQNTNDPRPPGVVSLAPIRRLRQQLKWQMDKMALWFVCQKFRDQLNEYKPNFYSSIQLHITLADGTSSCDQRRLLQDLINEPQLKFLVSKVGIVSLPRVACSYRRSY